MVPYGPLGRGALTGAITSRADLKEDDHRHGMPWFSQENLLVNLTTVDVLRRIGAEADATPGQVALAWLLAKAPDVVPIPGTRRAAFLAENSATTALTLTAEQIAVLDQITAVGGRERETAVTARNWFGGSTPQR